METLLWPGTKKNFVLSIHSTEKAIEMAAKHFQNKKVFLKTLENNRAWL